MKQPLRLSANILNKMRPAPSFKAFAREPFQATWGGISTHGCWYLPDTALGLAVLVHGFGEHSGRYEDSVIPFLTSEKWAVLAFDLVGHGHSGGKQGDCAGYPQLLEQVSGAWHLARARFPDLPALLYGHSMGGNLVLNFVLRGLGRPDALVASSPYLRLAFRPPAWKWWAGRAMLHLYPSITLPAGLDPAGISRDPWEVEAYRNDPLVHDRVSPRYSFPVIEAGEWALEHAKGLDVPTWVAHGTADPIIAPEGSRLFCKRAQVCQLYLDEGAYHELHHETSRQGFFEALGKWLRERQGDPGLLEAPHSKM